MSIELTRAMENAILHLAHAFDGYAYAKLALPGIEEPIVKLDVRLNKLASSGRFFLRAEENFAVNFYLHRMFHQWGDLPGARSPHWYDMVFLYLHLYRVPIATAYRHPDMFESWDQRPKGSTEKAAAEIRQVLRRPLGA
jgi:hypothetical protein